MDPVVVIGAGPAGLAAALELSRQGVEVVVVEAEPAVGGLSRTREFGGARFDVGPHRFFTKNDEVQALWADTLGSDFLAVPRLTRILYGRKLLNYPIAIGDVLRKVGPVKAAGFASSYLASRLSNAVRRPTPTTFEDWVVSRFGRALFEAFFQSYTEKVWGIPCSSVAAEWASQRIKGLSLSEAVRHAVLKPREQVKTLVDEFHYPRYGAGMMYERWAEDAQERGAEILLSTRATGIHHENGRAVAVTVSSAGADDAIRCSHVLTSNPITEMVLGLDPPAPASVLEAARLLRYRCHLSVNLLAQGESFPDNWIYVHNREVAMGRIANYRNFSCAMGGTSGATPVTVEYFYFPEDEPYENGSDEALIEHAKGELRLMRVIDPDQVMGGFVVRNFTAYPVLEIGYVGPLQLLKDFASAITNLQPIGRGGMFKYNNQDHSVVTGLLAARNVMGSEHNVWDVNIDGQYHESAAAG